MLLKLYQSADTAQLTVLGYEISDRTDIQIENRGTRVDDKLSRHREQNMIPAQKHTFYTHIYTRRQKVSYHIISYHIISYHIISYHLDLLRRHSSNVQQRRTIQ